MRRQAAFTLIELLVVVAIIGMLLAVIAPALKKAKRQAQATICLSNLSQIGLAAKLYTQDNDDYIPRGAAGNNSPLWFVQFLPYVGHRAAETDYRHVKIYRCPAWPMSGEGLYGIPNSRQTVCFVINAWTFRDRNDATGTEIREPTKHGTFRVPVATAYLADNEAGPWRAIIEDEHSRELPRCDVFASSHLPTSESQDITYGRRIARRRHREGCNVLFLDWHAEYVPAETMTIRMWRDR